MLECVINVSEGRRADVIAEIAGRAETALLDVHTDPDHHRSVLTLAADDVDTAARGVTSAAVSLIDLRHHRGAHPRLGAVDVVPFVPLAGSTLTDAVAARDGFARWAAQTLELPCFLYGPERSLPEIRRSAFSKLAPDFGPPTAHPSAGAMCIGARDVLVAYNVWLAPGTDLTTARAAAATVRSPTVRALGFDLGAATQVSMNLLDPVVCGPAVVYDALAEQVRVLRAELVGLIPASVLDATPAERWTELDLGPTRTIEFRLDRRQTAGGGRSS